MERIIRIIGYSILLILEWLVYYFLHSHFYFVLLVTMITAPVLSLISVRFLRRGIFVKICNLAGQSVCKQNEECVFKLQIFNKTIIPCLDARLMVNVENTFLETKGSQLFEIPVYWRFGMPFTIELPILASLPGMVRISVEEIRVKDLMGFVLIKAKLPEKEKYECEVAVMPQKLLDMNVDSNSYSAGMLESEESTKRGNDFSDVQEIREYIPGDKLMSIHWKLSAKRDILMVKDRVSMSDRQIIVVPELTNESIYTISNILCSTYSLISGLITDGTTVRLIYWSKLRYEYEDLRIDFESDLHEAFTKMYYESTYADNEAALHMTSVYPEIHSYVYVSFDGNQYIRIVEN